MITEACILQAVVALKFHPACYLHVYVFGVALATCYLRLQKTGARSPWIVRHGAILGYLMLFLIFACPPLRPPAHKLLCRLGGLAPLQGLLLVGLSGKCCITACLAAVV